MGLTFRPTTAGAPEITIEPDIIRGPRVWVGDTRVLPERARGRPIFPIPMADGSTRPLTLHGAFLGLRARFEDRDYEVEPRLHTLELFLVLLPLGLLTVAWPVGALLGAAGVMIGLVVIRRPWPFAARAGVIVGLFVVAFVLLGPGGLVG